MAVSPHLPLTPCTCTLPFSKPSRKDRYCGKVLVAMKVPRQPLQLKIIHKFLYQYLHCHQDIATVPFFPQRLCEWGCARRGHNRLIARAFGDTTVGTQPTDSVTLHAAAPPTVLRRYLYSSTGLKFGRFHTLVCLSPPRYSLPIETYPQFSSACTTYSHGWQGAGR